MMGRSQCLVLNYKTCLPDNVTSWYVGQNIFLLLFFLIFRYLECTFL